MVAFRTYQLSAWAISAYVKLTFAVSRSKHSPALTGVCYTYHNRRRGDRSTRTYTKITHLQPSDYYTIVGQPREERIEYETENYYNGVRTDELQDIQEQHR